MRSLFKMGFFLLLASLASATPLLAADTLTWAGTTSTDFNDITNWTGSTMSTPAWQAGDTLNILIDLSNVGRGNLAVINISPSVSFAGVNLGNGGNSGSLLQNDGDLSYTGSVVIGNADLGVTSVYQMTGGTLSHTLTTGSVNIGTNAGHGELWMNGGGTFTSAGGATYIGVNTSGVGSLVMSGASSFTSAGGLDVGYNAAATGNITMSDNAVLSNTSSGGAWFGYSGIASGSLTMSGNASFTQTGGAFIMGYSVSLRQP
jgi:hypothetical protein